jgi:hypothetical protein
MMLSLLRRLGILALSLGLWRLQPAATPQKRRFFVAQSTTFGEKAHYL